MPKMLAAVALGVVFLLCAQPAAEACSCAPSGPACQAFWNTEAVFDGTVVRIETTTREETVAGRTIPGAWKLVTFDVRQAWKGATRGTFQALTWRDGAGCGYDFKEGVRYLVFASRWRSAELEVSSCSATRPYDGTGPDAEFLASLAKPPAGGRVQGQVRFNAARVSQSSPEPAMPPGVEVRISLAGRDGVRTTLAKDGKYEFSGLEPGSYHVGAAVTSGYSVTSWPETVLLPNAYACGETYVSVTPGGTITGQIVDASGRGVRSIRVDVIAQDTKLPLEWGSSVSSSTDDEGVFTIAAVPPGRYLAVLNSIDLPSQYTPYPLTIYPGPEQPAHVIDLSLGQSVDLGRWQLPAPLPVVKIAGFITWSDGTPAAGIHVGLWDVTSNPESRARGAGSTRSAADGSFIVEGREGRVYELRVRGEPLKGPEGRIEARAGVPLLRLVLPRQ